MSSLNGISANVTKTTYTMGIDPDVILYVKNDNNQDTMSTVTPQKFDSATGKWTDFSWWYPVILSPEENDPNDFTIGSGEDFPDKGTFRFKLSTAMGDNNIDLGTFYSPIFYIK